MLCDASVDDAAAPSALMCIGKKLRFPSNSRIDVVGLWRPTRQDNQSRPRAGFEEVQTNSIVRLKVS
jgi:hypothetical protein